MKRKILATVILLIMVMQALSNCIVFASNEISERNEGLSSSEKIAINTIVDNKDTATNIPAINIITNSENITTNTIENNQNIATNTLNNNEQSVENEISSVTEETIKENIKDEKEESPSKNKDVQIDIDISDQYITEDDLLYSNKYLVKDKVVSRIDPKTTIKEFESNVKVAQGNTLSYFEKDGTTPVSSNIVGTGMKVKGTNGQEYRLSIKGDITGEGEANQVELTMIIRDLIELQGWELKDIDALSGDITGDGKIDIVDINKMIRHIVFGDWDYDDRTTPNPPTIEVIGEKGAEEDEFTSEVKIKITEDKSTENSKTTYKITGTKQEEESQIDENQIISITEDGEYKITAYTYGIQGNRSKASNRNITIKITQKAPQIYNINYELNGGENNSENPSTYTAGTEVEFKDPTKLGHTFKGWYRSEDFKEDTKIEKIEKDQTGDVTVYAKWEPNKYNIEYELDGGENNKENPSTYTYGIELILKDPTKKGFDFEGWYTDKEFKEDTKIEKIEKGKIGDIKLHVKWKAKVYNINYELNGGENNSENPSTYTYGTEVIFKNATKEGYNFKGWYRSEDFKEETKIEKIEPGEMGDITVYAKWEIKQYTVTFKDGENIVKTEKVNHGEDATAPEIEKPGYSLSWDKDFTNVKQDLIVNAIWEANSTAYKVEHYKQNITLDGYELAETENLTGITDTKAVAQIKEYEGFIEDTENENRIIEGNIEGDGSLVLKVYYKRAVYNISYELDGGENNSENPSTYIYGTEVIFKKPSKIGYTFKGWYTSENFEEETKIQKIEKTQTGDVIVYAKWIRNDYKLTVHHYEKESTNKVAEDEIFAGEQIGEAYQTKSLIPTLDEQGNIVETDDRQYLNAKKYYVVSIEGEEQGTYIDGEIEVTYYYDIYEFNITGEAGEGGTIENAEETVKYGENSTKEIIITPNEGKIVEKITINNEEITNYNVNEETNIVTLPIFENVTENKHVVVTFESSKMVAEIVYAPEGYEHLIGTQYTSINKAVIASPSIATIKVIANTEKEPTAIINKTITLDLNGKIVQGENVLIDVKEQSITIINSSSQAANLVSKENESINVKENATLTLGQDDGNIKTESIVIEGKDNGIITNGTFNFYDGQIIGKTAINGNVDDTPTLYNAIVTEEGEKKKATLAIIANAEALINKKAFTKLEEAIEYANTEVGQEGSQVEIIIVKDIVREDNDDSILIKDKNILLDLNGYTITSKTLSKYTINNVNSNLEIIDSSEEKTGIISNQTENVAINNNSGKIKVTGIKIKATKGIKNETSESKLEIIDSTFDALKIYGSTTTAGYAVENYENSTTKIISGNFDGRIMNGEFNKSGNPTLEIEEGNFNYGIVNNNGKAIINGGTFSIIDNVKEMEINGGEITKLINKR